MQKRLFLIVKADGTARVNTKPRSLSIDEIAVPLTINIPDAWGKAAAEGITINMPEPPTVDEVVTA